MRNHYQLLGETGEPNLSRLVRQLNGHYTQGFNRRHRRVGHLFQGRYTAILVDKDAYLLELNRYIHLNPVRVGEVRAASAYAWSSAAAYVGRQAAPAFVFMEEVLAAFGRQRRRAPRAYAEFLAEGSQRGAAQSPWPAVVAQTLLGAAPWVEAMRERLAGTRRQSSLRVTRMMAERSARDNNAR